MQNYQIRNKIIDLGAIMHVLKSDYFATSETKLGERFPTSQFQLNGYDTLA